MNNNAKYAAIKTGFMRESEHFATKLNNELYIYTKDGKEENLAGFGRTGCLTPFVRFW